MENLRTDFLDDVLNASENTRRKFRMITNDDGTISFEDVTAYSQVGDSFGAADVNKITGAVNELNESLPQKIKISGTIEYGALNITSYVPANTIPIGFKVEGGNAEGIQSCAPHIWYNTGSNEYNIAFRTWADNTLINSGTVSGTIICV